MSHTWRSEDILRYPWMSSSILFGTRSLLFSPAHIRLAGPGASVGSISHLSSNKSTRIVDTHCCVRLYVGTKLRSSQLDGQSPQLERLSFRCGLSDASRANTPEHPENFAIDSSNKGPLHSCDRKAILLSDLDANSQYNASLTWESNRHQEEPTVYTKWLNAEKLRVE